MPYSFSSTVRFNESGFNTSSLLKEYFTKVILPWKESLNKKVILILDQAPCHTSKDFTDFLDKTELTYLFLPGGCTHIFQPLDVSINKPFKDELRNLYVDWLQRQVLKTNVTVITPPNPENILDWVMKAIQNLTSNKVKDSFRQAGALDNVGDLYNEELLTKKLEKVVEEYFIQDACEREYLDFGDKIIETLSLEQELFLSS